MRKLTVISVLMVFCIAIGVNTQKREVSDGAQMEIKESTFNNLSAGVTKYTNSYEKVSFNDTEEDPEPTKESYIYNDPLNQKDPYNNMSADWGSEVYEDGFKYYEIPQEYKEDGGEFPEVVQVYLWEMCKQKNLNYYLVVALIERESHYKYDCLGDNGNSFGYMQIYKKYHTERMEKERVTDLMDPYGNIRVGTTFLQELFSSYGNSGDNCVLMVYNMGAGGAKKLWKKGIYSSEYSRQIVRRSKEIEQELTQD